VELLAGGQLGSVDVIHCHDWHTGMFLVLREYAERFRALRDIRSVFTIHNLALQGTRPLRGFDYSLESWYPGLEYDVRRIADRDHPDCINPMRAAINLADFVNTVSPTYAEEILRPRDPETGHVSGEELEVDLQQLEARGRLAGILNGCDYSNDLPQPIETAGVWNLLERSLDRWVEDRPGDARIHYHARRRLEQLKGERLPPAPLVLSINRLCTQKLSLLMQCYQGATVADELLRRMKGGLFILAGTGDPVLQDFLTDLMCRHNNFLFLCGYSEELTEALHGVADMFLMPSEFEPCGISQLLAMRAGLPCLVHQVGGLKDTVLDGVNGFSFRGDTLSGRLEDLVQTFQGALDIFADESARWAAMSQRAAAARFDWEHSVEAYCTRVYEIPASFPEAEPEYQVAM
jgi:starch synthase